MLSACLVFQAATQATTTSGAAHLTKRRLAFETSPGAKRRRSASTTDAVHGRPCASAMVQPPGNRSHRPAIPIGGRRAGKDRRPRDQLGRIVSLAKARLMQSRQKTEASNEDQSQKTPGYRSATKTVARTGKTGQRRSGSSGLISLRPRKAPGAASGTDASVSAANTGGAQKGTGSSVSDGRAANQTLDREGSRTATPNNGSAKTEKTRQSWSRTEPPAGVTIRP